MAYIFSNSTKNQKESDGTSKAITEHIKPIVDPDNKISESKFNHMLRKTAHLVEFAVLGIFLALLFDSIKKRFKKTDIFAPLFVALSAAVADEYIQTFNDRGSQVEDVLIDIGGAAAAIIIVSIILFLTRKRKYKF